MDKLILSTKLRNAITKANPTGEYEFFLKNIIINGNKRGCSGFIRSAANGAIAYVNTEPVPVLRRKYMYRYADSTKDYTGYCNRWAENLEDLSKSIVSLLQQTPAEARDFRI